MCQNEGPLISALAQAGRVTDQRTAGARKGQRRTLEWKPQADRVSNGGRTLTSEDVIRSFLIFNFCRETTTEPSARTANVAIPINIQIPLQPAAWVSC